MKSSALPYLSSAMNSKNPTGVLSIKSTIRLTDTVTKLIRSKQLLTDLSRDQAQLLTNLEGRNILFAKDYLNYFLDANFSVHNARRL